MNGAEKNILVLNAGSSSTKVSLYTCVEIVEADVSPPVLSLSPQQEPIWQLEVDFPKGSLETIEFKKASFQYASADRPAVPSASGRFAVPDPIGCG